MVGILGVAGPGIRDADAAGESRRSIDHQQFPMRTVVDAVRAVPHGRMKPAHDHAGVLHLRQLGGVELVAAQPIEEHMDLDPGLGAFCERVGKFPADRSRPVDIAFESNGMLRTADRGQHGREDFVAVAQDLEPVAVQDCRAKQHAHRATELLVLHAVLTHDGLLDLLLAAL
jgi:hypothetical protein